jgi:hyperosmotically inducible protein
MNIKLSLLLCSALVVLSAQAQDNAKTGPNAGFVQLDTNKDNFLSRSEARANKGLSKVFSKADLNKDGKLDEDEYLKGVTLYRREKTTAYAGDATITTKVKTALLGATGVPSTAISVATAGGKVTLSGTVETKAQMAEAVKVAKAVGGVTSVQNKLQVK